MANLRDVARRARFDPFTVSRVPRGDPAQAVRLTTRPLILDAARELGYRPNQLAQALRAPCSGTVALLVDAIESLSFTEVSHEGELKR
jgi:LacI family transcriptional regulator